MTGIIVVVSLIIIGTIIIVYSAKNEFVVEDDEPNKESAQPDKMTEAELEAKKDLRSFRPKVKIYQDRLAALADSSLPTIVNNALNRAQMNDIVLNEFIEQLESDNKNLDDLLIQSIYYTEKEVCQDLEAAITMIEIAALDNTSMQDFIFRNGTEISNLLTRVDRGNDIIERKRAS